MDKAAAARIARAWSTSRRYVPVLATALFVAVMFVLVSKGLALLHQESAFNELKRWVRLDAGYDSWHSMGIAYQGLNTHGGLLYQQTLLAQTAKFQYPPSSLLLYSAAAACGVAEPKALFNLAGWVFSLVQVAAVAVLAVICGRRTEGSAAPAVWAGVAALACLTFYPVVKAFTLGQVQMWINACFAVACVFWATGRKAAAGVLIGAIGLIKPQFALFLLWGGLRRQWTFVAGWATVVIPGLAASVALYGLANHLDYLSALRLMASHGEAFFPNQSVNGLLNRLLANGDNLVWSGNGFAPYHPLVYAGTLASSAAMLLFALFRYRRRTATLFDFLTAGLLFTMASPIAWEHHYGVLPPAFVALCFAILALPPSGDRATRWLCLAAAFSLSAHYLPFTQSLAATPFNFLQSYLFFGALLTAGLLDSVPDPEASRPHSSP
jgi:alpha-1,2-mannosyltransferase